MPYQAATTPDDAIRYALIDSGNGRRLEQFGPVRVDRPCPAATWSPGCPDHIWTGAHLRFDKASTAAQTLGTWTGIEHIPDPWRVALGGVSLTLKPASNGQLGIFPEHAQVWSRLTFCLNKTTNESVRMLNVFAYTGGATVAAALTSGAISVTHVDSSRASVEQARANASENGLGERELRWIVDDAMAFLEREIRRNQRYDIILLDPPAFGRGPKGKTWKLERDLLCLIDVSARLLSDAPLAWICTCHDPAWPVPRLRKAWSTALRKFSALAGGRTNELELSLRAQPPGRDLPLSRGIWHDWTAPD